MNDGQAGGGTQKGAILLALLAFVGAAMIAVLVWQTVASSARRDDAIALQRQSYGVMIVARDLDATLGSAEATLGRFVISGDQRVGRLYADSWRRAGTLLDRLARDASPSVRPQVDELRAAYVARGEELGAVALRTTYKQNDQALSRYYLAGKSKTLDRLKAAVDGLIARERTTLEVRAANAEATVARSNRTVTLLSAAGVVLVLVAGVLGTMAWVGRVRRRDEEARNLELEDAVSARTAELHSEMAEREATEAKLRQAHKMEAIGQLTGGIAHDFNNMLAVVVGGIELAQRRLLQGTGDVSRHLDRAMEGAVRAAALTKRLLAFARAEPLLPIAVDPQALIAGMVELLDRTLGDTVKIAIDSDSCWPVFVDAHQLENALLNLAVNARDAMPDGGTVSIATHNAALTDGAVPHLVAGEYVCIAVRDSGMGMDDATIERAFEPFFTTKGHGRGTGLGLSQAFGFVRQSGGSITIHSEPGSGTTVSLYLPRHATGTMLNLASTPQDAPTTVTRQGRPVLLIEDDPRVLASTAAALAELGHEPLPCAGPSEVPAVLRARRDIGLIVSDVLMPGITGPELVAAIRELHPKIPVLFMTGFAGDIEDAAQFGGNEVLRKPFTLTTLAAALDRVLDEEAPILHAEAA
jgi:signal transduction histidine kinase/ActR/RegA family two-component response regulator